ncbi:hypothetical protein [Marixanthomonas spongiae]|uniref:Uncharacterized protein n=1 Tax=Marixanthomonas spongiae TaxID=2174845 RepID=A0A2U0I5S2_9FLAO|nr:hypothetical protein [Marixanthomonas spongiae]PVW16414.1 hypothetical protein DDV96_03920 [Marixanthomonas spongiae]
MARQTGIIKISGTIDGVNFYKTKAGHLSRKAGGGFTSHAIKTKPNMRRVRENGTEFGRCSKSKKHFNQALRPFLCIHKDGTLHGRMMRRFTGLKKLDTVSARGERHVGQGIQTEEGKRLLRDFNFTPSCAVASFLSGTTHYDASNHTFTVTDFDVKQISFPTGATHIAVTLGVLHFDFDTNRYELQQSPPTYIDAQFTADTFSLQAPAPTLPGTAIAVIGVKFYQEVGGQFVVLRGKDTVGLLVVSVMD